MEHMQPFNWGVAGTTERLRAFADDLYHAVHPHRLAAIVGEEEALDFPGAAIVPDLDGLLQAGIDAVYLATPFPLHYQQVARCLKQRVPVLCERPIAENAGQLKSLMQLAEEHHTFMMEAMWIRFLPSVKKVLSIVSSGTVGEVVSVKAAISPRAPGRVAPGAENFSVALVELGLYPVFLATLFLGKPEYVQATGKGPASGKTEYFSAFLSYRAGQYAFLETSLAPGASSVVIQGEGGRVCVRNPWSPKPEGIEVDLLDGTKVLHRSEWPGVGLHFELDEVAACVRQGQIESPLYCHHFMLDVLHTMDAIRTQLL
jgi:scyllo-inositol 2-dehydrogenase (NADP+)